ncbi:XRE family transcriptional regulator [Pinirhizobacter sp.]|jgi:DNA-binding Xre family transcriptional regulator|uniref:XRE family transcriptional regulator n=1 Tax=Pinirhizobacter sp. TaxID=2950432 RepID=UPI002F42C77F
MPFENKYIGSSFDDFLAECGILAEVTATATKRVMVWQIEEAMKAQDLTRTALAAKMGTSEATLNDLLDARDSDMTLTTLAKAAAALGKTLRVQFI